MLRERKQRGKMSSEEWLLYLIEHVADSLDSLEIKHDRLMIKVEKNNSVHITNFWKIIAFATGFSTAISFLISAIGLVFFK